jgi:hypothetical protein
MDNESNHEQIFCIVAFDSYSTNQSDGICRLYLPYPPPSGPSSETKDSISASRFTGTFRGSPGDIAHILDVDVYRERVILIGSAPIRPRTISMRDSDSRTHHRITHNQGALVDPDDPRNEKFNKRSWSHDFAGPRQHTCLCRQYRRQDRTTITDNHRIVNFARQGEQRQEQGNT